MRLREIEQLTANEVQEQILVAAIEIKNKMHSIKAITYLLIADIIITAICVLNV